MFNVAIKPDGLITGELIFFYTLLFAFFTCALTLFALLQYITYFSVATELEKEMKNFVFDLSQKAQQKRDTATTLKEIKILLDRYTRVFETLNESKSNGIKSHSRGAMNGGTVGRYGISDLTRGQITVQSDQTVGN